MKWNDKNHEYDAKAKEISEKWKISNDVYLFGAGNVGKIHRSILDKFNLFSGFIDNDVCKWSGNTMGLSSFLRGSQKGWIILCGDNSVVEDMQREISALHIDKYRYFVYGYKDFFKEIFPIISAYELGKVFDSLCQISVTERCTLKCEKCAHGCWNVPMDQEDLSLDAVKESADYYFNAFDYVQEFVLIGGEPFLYKDLAESIRYIGDHYREQIITFAITTNGTIIPSEEIIGLCKEFDVHIHISNYVKTIPTLKERYEKLCKILDEQGISYDLSDEDDKWVDYGFNSLVRGDEEDLQAVFDKCKTPCREVRRNKYYFCVQARAVSENLLFDVDDDYFDLSQIKSIGDKKALMEFCMGYSEKGYLDMCKYCYGADALNHIIPRAVQRKA